MGLGQRDEKKDKKYCIKIHKQKKKKIESNSN